MLAFDDLEPADARANENANCVGIFGSHLQPSHIHRKIRSGNGEMHEPGHLLDLFLFDELSGIEPLHLAGNRASMSGRIKKGDRPNARTAGLQTFPRFFSSVA